MSEKEYAKGIYIKKFNGQFGEWLSVSVRVGENEYKRYKFYPKKEQKSDKYVDYYGIVDNWQPKQQDTIGDDSIPF